MVQIKKGVVPKRPMDVQRLLQNRLLNQRLIHSPDRTVAETVSWLGAVQSQEFNDAKWSIAQRIPGLTDEELTTSLNKGEILRTHVLRPTWHFVAAEDIRWMLALTAPRVKAFMASYDRQLSLNETVYVKSNRLIHNALADGRHLTRPELRTILEQQGISLEANRLAHLLMRAELDGIICSGIQQGKQQTYALLDQRVPPTKNLSREEALAELAKRYFLSHGPATVQDYSWWSGLTMTDARLGLEAIKPLLASEVIEGNTYWFAPAESSVAFPPQAYALPNFDEYAVGYRDRSMLLETGYSGPLLKQGEILNHRNLVLSGQIVGSWKPVTGKAETKVVLTLLRPLSDGEQAQFRQLFQQYGQFLGRIVVLEFPADGQYVAY